MKSCLALVLVLALTLAEPCFSFRFSPWRVRVFNNMTNGQTVSIHCKSKDDDLGQHNLEVGKELTWGFRENILSSTLFWCYIRNQHDHVSLEVFNAKDYNLYYRCKGLECIWSIRDDGIYQRNKSRDNKFYLRAKWEPGW